MTTINQGGKEFRIYTTEEWSGVRRQVQQDGFRPVNLASGLFAGTELVKAVNRIEDETGSRPLVVAK